MLGLVRVLIDYNGLVNAPRVAELGLMLVAEISGVHLRELCIRRGVSESQSDARQTEVVRVALQCVEWPRARISKAEEHRG